MSAFKSASPKIKSYMVGVDVPTNKLLAFNFNGTDVQTAEKYFAELAKYQDDADKKEDCQKCQLTLKWAYSCNGALKRVAPCMGMSNNHGVSFMFEFKQLCDLEAFVRDLKTNLA